jgi:hypothetical protein
MHANLFWFDDEQWAKIEPHLPANQLLPACRAAAAVDRGQASPTRSVGARRAVAGV